MELRETHRASRHLRRAQEILGFDSHDVLNQSQLRFGAPELQEENEYVFKVNGHDMIHSTEPFNLEAEVELEVIGVKSDESLGQLIEAEILKLSRRRLGNLEEFKNSRVYIMNKSQDARNKKVLLILDNNSLLLLNIVHWELQEPNTFESLLGVAVSRDMHRLYKPGDSSGEAGEEFLTLLRKYKAGM